MNIVQVVSVHDVHVGYWKVELVYHVHVGYVQVGYHWIYYS